MTDPRERLVRDGWEAYNRGDLEATVAQFSPDLIVHAPLEMANAGTYHGIDGFISWVTQWNEAWESFDAEVKAVELIGERHVLTEMRQSGIGRGSGIEVAMETTWVIEVRDGLCVYLAIYPEAEPARAEALARER